MIVVWADLRNSLQGPIDLSAAFPWNLIESPPSQAESRCMGTLSYRILEPLPLLIKIPAAAFYLEKEFSDSIWFYIRFNARLFHGPTA